MSERNCEFFRKGDIIQTEPEKGYYGIAIVLDDGTIIEYEPGNWSSPLCHIAITPLIFDHMVSFDELDYSSLKPLEFMRCFSLKGKPEFYKSELMIHIFATRNTLHLPILGTIDPSVVYQGELFWRPQGDSFHWCGEIGGHFGREAYISWRRSQQGFVP